MRKLKIENIVNSMCPLYIPNYVKKVELSKKSPLISVIITVKSYAHLLHNCIDSIIEQSYSRLEIILVVTECSDTSYEICKKFEKLDARIKVFKDIFDTESDMKSFGLSKAHGDYITFVTGSDFISLNYIEYQLSLLQKYDADISECEFIKVPEIEVASDTFEPPKQNEERETVLLPWQAIENLHSVSHNTCVKTVVLWNKLFKKEVFNRYRIS